ncbi:MAG TPA: alpha/beta hydrolase [Solirubrobacteraceae bacterium]|jgi:pimeloyl-ACP methyl ester carboxylesterase|nr:alpha/beta hydrolase [Solirubrobacteraceae bacterium]
MAKTPPEASATAARGGSPIASVTTLTLEDGRALCVRRWPGTGDPLVLLHGLLDSSEGWNHLAELPCQRIAFDLPGFGHSDAPERGSLAGYARDIAAGLEMLGVERFNLVGHSLGGGIAAALAEMMPERVGAIVLLAPVGFGRIPLAEAVSLPGVRQLVQGALPLALSSRLAVTAAYLTMVTNGMLPERAIVDRLTDRAGKLVAGAREGTRAAAEAGRGHGAFHRRGIAYDGPVFAIWGDQDRLVPSSHRAGVLAALPQAHVDVWSGMGHHPLRERFEDLIAIIERAAGASERRRERRPLPRVA